MKTKSVIIALFMLQALCLSGCQALSAARQPRSRPNMRLRPASVQNVATIKASVAEMQAAGAGIVWAGTATR